MSAVAAAEAGALLDRAAAGWRPWALLVALCLGLFLPGIAAMPPLDRDEARFMQASRQMAATGDLVEIRFQDAARNKKPAGIYWLQAASIALLSTPSSTAAWPYRLPSLIGATLAVLLTFRLGATLLGRPAALLGAALLASSALLVAEAHLAKTDAVLLATVVAAQGALAAAYRRAAAGARAGPGTALAFWLAQGCGILVKGPVTPLVSALTILALILADRRWRWLGALRPQWGAPLALAMILPWLAAVETATGGAFASEAIGHDFLGKLVGAQESHGAPPGAYLLLLPATFWPSSIALAAAGIAAWRRRVLPAERFLIAWVVPGWLLFELVPTKLPHYVLPFFPAIALLAGSALAAAEGVVPDRRRRRLDGALFAVWAAVGLALAVALVALPPALGSGPAMASLVPAAAVVGGGLMLLKRRLPGLTAGAVPIVAALALGVFAPGFATLLPGLDGLWLSRGAAAAVARHPTPEAAAVVDTVGYSEPSLVFLLGGQTRAVGAEQAAADLAAGRAPLALVAGEEAAAFARAVAARGGAATALEQIDGIDYSRGSRRMTLTLFAAVPG